MHQPFVARTRAASARDFSQAVTPPNQMRWDPLPIPATPADFLDGLVTMGGNGDPQQQTGCAIHLYAANRSMTQRAFYSADGELLIVPQQGRLLLITELGRLELEPLEVAVIPRGVRFSVELRDATARGYVCENFGAAFRLPDLARSARTAWPASAIFLRRSPGTRTGSSATNWWQSSWAGCGRAQMDHSPFDVVAWRGNLAPYKYDLRRFNTIGSISFDHPDPSIFLVLQSVTDTAGVDAVDFVVSPALARDGAYVPPAVVPSQCRQRIHGADRGQI